MAHRRLARRFLLVGGLLALVGAAATILWLTTRKHGGEADDAARAEAVAVAREALIAEG